MKRGMDWEQKILLNELKQGKDFATQLQNNLNPSSCSSQTRILLVEKILRSYEKALSMINSGTGSGSETVSITSVLESPPSVANCTEAVSDRKDVSKKRKIMSKWTEHVRVGSGSSLDGPIDDGHCWRKYGQKDILGSTHPRGYYRCTHRHSQGCLATKQVQRSDDDRTIFEVTYRGRHTCRQSSQLAAPAAAASAGPLVKPKKADKVEEVVLNYESRLIVKTEGANSGSKGRAFPSFYFPMPGNGSEEGGSSFFPESMLDDTILGSLSPAFISPTTSESNYFAMSPCHVGSFGLVQSSESDFTEIISAPGSVTNSPIGDFDFPTDLENFSFDNIDYFS